MTREQLTKALENVRRCICAYPKDPCDCKYGFWNCEVYQGAHPRINYSEYGEQTGCCEVREAISLLSAMTDAEFIRIQNRCRKQTLSRIRQIKAVPRDQIFGNLSKKSKH